MREPAGLPEPAKALLPVSARRRPRHSRAGSRWISCRLRVKSDRRKGKRNWRGDRLGNRLGNRLRKKRRVEGSG